MKSIQIILLFCIHLSESFPKTMNFEDVQNNLAFLLKKGLIREDLSDVVTSYSVTDIGFTIIGNLYKNFNL